MISHFRICACKTVPESPTPVAANRCRFSKVLSIAPLRSKCTRSLTFQNLCLQNCLCIPHCCGCQPLHTLCVAVAVERRNSSWGQDFLRVLEKPHDHLAEAAHPPTHTHTHTHIHTQTHTHIHTYTHTHIHTNANKLDIYTIYGRECTEKF